MRSVYLELGDAHALEHAGLEAAPRLARVVEDDAPLEERRERRRAAGEERVAALAVERVRLVVDRAGDARVRERAERLVLAPELAEGTAGVVEHAARHRRVEGQRFVPRIVRAAAERVLAAPRVDLCVVLTLTP